MSYVSTTQVDYDEKIGHRGHVYYDRINTSIHSAIEYFRAGSTHPDFVRTWLFYSEVNWMYYIDVMFILIKSCRRQNS